MKLIKGVLCNIEYPSEIHLKLKSRESLFSHNLFVSYLIALKWNGSDTAMLCAKFQNDWAIETGVMDSRDFTGFCVTLWALWIAELPSHQSRANVIVQSSYLREIIYVEPSEPCFRDFRESDGISAYRLLKWFFVSRNSYCVCLWFIMMAQACMCTYFIFSGVNGQMSTNWNVDRLKRRRTGTLLLQNIDLLKCLHT